MVHRIRMRGVVNACTVSQRALDISAPLFGGLNFVALQEKGAIFGVAEAFAIYVAHVVPESVVIVIVFHLDDANFMWNAVACVIGRIARIGPQFDRDAADFWVSEALGHGVIRFNTGVCLIGYVNGVFDDPIVYGVGAVILDDHLIDGENGGGGNE